MMQYFSVSELLVSSTADRLGLSNDPPRWVVANLERLIMSVLDPLRQQFGGPIIVNSGYRSIAVNNAVGGVPTSQHLRGLAADIRGYNKDATLRLWQLAQSMTDLPIDQLINERPGPDGCPTWVHISTSRKPRHQVLTLR